MTLLPFTPFQKLLRQWETVSPQNGAQAMLVDGVLDPDLVESAWQSTLRDMGLGRVHVDEDEGYSHEIWSGDPPTPLVSHMASDVQVVDYLQEQMNRRFMAAPAMPYRAFALQQGERCYLGVVYQQWVADSVSIRLLMREWFLRIFYPTRARRKLIDLPRLRAIRGPELGWRPGPLLGAVKGMYRWLKQRKQMSTFAWGEYVGETSLHRFSLNADELDDVLMVTRAEGCTLNDLLIAALASAIAPSLPRKASADLLSVATSIDLRPYAPGDLSETFGSLLAYVPVTCPRNQSSQLDLAQEVARQTKRFKDPERIAQHLLLPRLLAWWASRQENGQIAQYFQKHVPVCATIANVNLNKSWLALHYPAPVRKYLRVASASPAMPVAVAASTLGDQFDVIVSTQSGGIAEQAGKALAEAFASGLRSLVQSRPAKHP